MKKLQTLREGLYLAWAAFYMGLVFIFCQTCGLIILGPKEFFREGPIN